MGDILLYDDKINEIEDLNNFYIHPYKNIEYKQIGTYKLVLK